MESTRLGNGFGVRGEKKGGIERIFQIFDLRNQAVGSGIYRDGGEYKNSLKLECKSEGLY